MVYCRYGLAKANVSSVGLSSWTCCFSLMKGHHEINWFLNKNNKQEWPCFCCHVFLPIGSGTYQKISLPKSRGHYVYKSSLCIRFRICSTSVYVVHVSVVVVSFILFVIFFKRSGVFIWDNNTFLPFAISSFHSKFAAAAGSSRWQTT